MTNRISNALTVLFDKHRIVFWYDAKRELREDFVSLELPGVKKIEIANNEYAVKFRILRKESEQKFLLYHESQQPDDLDNWLLDVLLAHGEFRADQVGIWLSELELGVDFIEVVQGHEYFFRAAKRKDGLKKLLKHDDTAKTIRLKMLGICAGSEGRMDSVLENLLQELAEGEDEKIRLIERSGLANFFWKQAEVLYGYQSDSHTIRDFAITLFKSSYANGIGETGQLSDDALVIFRQWKDSRIHAEHFKKLSEEYAPMLGMKHDLAKRDYRDLLGLDYFQLIDQKVIRDLVQAVAAKTISAIEVRDQIRLRRQSVWYGEYEHLYEAIDAAAHFIHLHESVHLEAGIVSEAVDRYCQSWFKIDQLYRQFAYHIRLSVQPTLMGALTEQIENLYTNNFLLKLGNRFQELVSTMDAWKIPSVRRQDEFFVTLIQPFLRKDNKVCVIISDALRYEIGEELQRAIRQEDRFTAELSPMLSMLPSYTQLGMAALLPNKELSIADNESGNVLIDGQSSIGTENRSKILQTALQGRGRAVTAEELLAMGKEDTRDLLKNNDVLYIYHNRIDKASEDTVFEAAQETINELVRLIKKLTGNNVSNLVVTADHGFLYQSRAIDESDFSNVDIQEAQILYKDRRFLLGHGLVQTQGVHTFTPAQLGLAGVVEVQIPKSINRLRLKGAGSRYVHGGATLQEVVVPIVKINKKRQSDTSVVAVEILGDSSSVITSGQLAVTLYQREGVTDKMHPRALRAGIYTENGSLISDSHELRFDRTSDNPRDREQRVRFILSSKADEANGKEVLLKLEEQVAGTSHYTAYATRRYIMRRSFTSDFDF